MRMRMEEYLRQGTEEQRNTFRNENTDVMRNARKSRTEFIEILLVTEANDQQYNCVG